MTFPFYVKSIVKYKSPHPQDLSFLRGETIRVTGYAERTTDPASQGESFEEEEDDRWYLGESLDGSKQGQFPASLVEMTEMQTESQPEQQVQAAQPIPTILPQPPAAHTNECAPDTGLEGVHAEEPANMEAQEEKGATPPLEESMSAMKDEKNQASTSSATTSMDPAPDKTPAPMDPQTSQSVSARSESRSSDRATGMSPESLPVEPPPSSQAPASVETKPLDKVKSYQPVSSVGERAASDKSITEPLAMQDPTEVEPSRMSLRDRIAAFNRTATKAAPPPIPKGKPGAWKRSQATIDTEKPLFPTQTPPAVASTTGTRDQKAPLPSHRDTNMDIESSSFSASDAKSSIKMSLKERMAALQRGHEGDAKIPAPIEQAAPAAHKQEEHAQDPHEEKSEDEATRRAAIAKRMAALGGRRVDAGLFGLSAAPPAPAENNAEQEASESTKERQAEPVAETDSSDQVPQTLVVPKRAAAPRTRRTKPTEPTSPMDQETETTPATQKQPNSSASLSVQSEPDVPAVHDKNAPVTEPERQGSGTGPVVQQDPGSSPTDLDARLGQMTLAETDSRRGSASTEKDHEQSHDTSPRVLPVPLKDDWSLESQEAMLQKQEAMALSQGVLSETQTTMPAQADEEPSMPSSANESIPLNAAPSNEPVKDLNAPSSVVTRQGPEEKPQAHKEDRKTEFSSSGSTDLTPGAPLPPVIPGAEYVSQMSMTSPPLTEDVRATDHAIPTLPVSMASVISSPSVPSAQLTSDPDNSLPQLDEDNEFSSQQELLNHLLQSDNTETEVIPQENANGPDLDESNASGVLGAETVQESDPSESPETARREAITRRLARMGGQRIAGMGPFPIQTSSLTGQEIHSTETIPSSKTFDSSSPDQSVRSPTSPPLRMPPSIPAQAAEPTLTQEHETRDREVSLKSHEPTRPPPRAPPRAPPPVPDKLA
ncbi:assembly of actin patch protein [Malassezia nana]|uniref:Assembly of actin patch protein n=1 Tax=Malassezia nana TaxID=180528 RepID=A0AAF0EIB1_9BASI|nr:assembly of actin patch protein [Malassezia nana]